jgi:tRNA modification GTPase
MDLEDTIAAISTPPGEGGIGIVRISGRDAIRIASRIFHSPKGKDLRKVPSHTIHYGYIIDPKEGERIDEVLVSVMRAPNTYTRQDIVEINCHGGMVPLRRVLQLAIREGARLANPGEFTLRAFLNGRIDLSQAEATADLIRAKTEKSSQIALQQLRGELSDRISSVSDRVADITAHIEAYIDFPEEDIEPMTLQQIQRDLQDCIDKLTRLSASYEEGRFFREGLAVAIVGKPNVGKSSLLNALLQEDRAIVTHIPGTTRDLIEEYINLNGIPLRIIDTAGIRQSKDLVESEGVKRTLQAVERADMVLAVFDMSSPLTDEDREVLKRVKTAKSILVLNKTDLPQVVSEREFPESLPKVKISAKTGEGLDDLKRRIETEVLKDRAGTEGVMVTNLRHKIAIDRAADSLKRASSCLAEKMPLEIMAIELREALQSLGEITGAVTTEDILNRIFSQFCIGK